MANRYNRPVFSRARRRSLNRKRLIIGGAAAALIVIAALVLLLPKGSPDRSVEAAVRATPTPASDEPRIAEGEPLVPLVSPTPTPQPTSQPTPEAVAADENPQRAATRPTATAEGFLPVFSKANTQEKIVAITVDDCNQTENLKQIVDKAIEAGGKLTIFPIGENLKRQELQEVLKYAWENGFELENHTFTHNGLYACDDETLANEVYKQQVALGYILGKEYQCHFLRPAGGDARGDQRMHMYARQLGYYGIAHWSASGSANKTKIAKALEPGAIYLFHTKDSDRDKLLKFIPWVVEQGYQLVTLNEMFGYPANETSPLKASLDEYPTPTLAPYEKVYVPLKKTSYSWEAYLVQQKLIELGYLTGEPDGRFGEGSEAAVKAYQKDHGMEQTGVVDADLVRTLLEGV